MQGLAAMSSMLHAHAWPELVHSLKTGRTAFEKVFGHEVFDYLPTDAEAARAFDAAMAGYTTMTGAAVAATYDFSRFATLVDVGGGSGALLTAILSKFPSLRGLAFDLPHVAERARVTLASAGLGERAQAVGGDLFQ